MAEVENYHAPETLEGALDILQGGEATIVCGGTDVMVQMQSGRMGMSGTLLNIRRIDALDGISDNGNEFRIGALATITELLENPIIAKHLPVLASAADQFASNQIRNMGTIGGNICNASPAGDMLPPLLVLDAEVELASKPNGHVNTRRLALADFLVGPGQTARKSGELLCAVHIPKPQPGTAMRFFKFGIRPALDISTISIAVAMRIKEGTVEFARLAYGAVAPTAIRFSEIEEFLAGSAVSEETFTKAAEMAGALAKPISDVRASAWYRSELIRNMTKRILNDAAKR